MNTTRSSIKIMISNGRTKWIVLKPGDKELGIFT